MPSAESAFGVQSDVRTPWRRYLDALVGLRPDLHRYCCRLAGNVWDGEDLVQDTLVRVFSLLGKMDADLANPRAYLVRTATHLWIDRTRRRNRERALLAAESIDAPRQFAGDPARGADVHAAAGELMRRLPPRERAAVLLKDVFDLSLEETASMLHTTVGAVKAALHRGRGRLDHADRDSPVSARPPSRAIVDRFVQALSANDIDALQALCSADLTVELVGGAEIDNFEHSRMFFTHAHMVLPALGFGEHPHWTTVVYDDEPIVIGFRTLNGIEGINEVHRIEESDDRIVRVRCYCFCPDTLRLVGQHLGLTALDRPYRSPP
ncbi:MAG TPA: RNA polymerase sigma factor [Candidatus Binatia bacterium]|nr:RNA polymerase sigma factor [Candidatus Binatia bacterium]